MERFRITRLEVNEIGPFGHLVMDFPDKPAGFEDKAEIHILTGENGTGKSTVLEMLTLPIPGSSTTPELIGKSRTMTGESWLTMTFTTGQPYSFKFIKGNVEMSCVALASHLEGYREGVNNYIHNEFEIAFFAYSGYRRIENARIHNIVEITQHPLSESLSFKNSVNPSLLLQWIANTITNESIEKTQGNPELSSQYRNSISQLEKAIELITGKTIRFFLKTNPLRVEINYDNEYVTFDFLADGVKSIIAWIADLLVRMERIKWENNIPVFERNFILFLDEIEVHMHPAWQRKILPAVQNLFPNAQIFVSTHSPFVVGSVDGAWIHKLEKPNGDSRLAQGSPYRSEDGNSVDYILEAIFDITGRQRFGPGAEGQLKQFYTERDAIRQGANGQTIASFLRLANELAVQSGELRLIVEMEIRQLNRQKNLDLQLTR